MISRVAPAEAGGRADVWIADPPSAFRSVAMEGMAIVFHRPSGITHILATPAPELIAALGDRAMTVAELLAALGVDADGAAALIAERLAELEEAGLVRRA